MSYSRNDGTYGTPFGWRDHQQQPDYYPRVPQHQNVPVTDNSSSNGRYVTGESYMHSGYTPNTDPWSNFVPPETSFTGYRGESWQGNHYPDQASLTMRMEAVSLSDHSIPVGQRPTFLPHSPSAGWTQPTWAHPEHTARRHSDQRSSMNAHGTRAEVSPYRPASRSVNAGHREAAQTGYPQPATTRTSRNDPVPPPVTTSPTQSRGERWAPSDAPTFRCQWVTHGTRCGALIPYTGDRGSVTRHLRDRHGDFSSDGTTIPCGWAGCTALPMQRRNIPRHILACHLEVKAQCPVCGLSLSRPDARRKHQQACPGALGAEEDQGVY